MDMDNALVPRRRLRYELRSRNVPAREPDEQDGCSDTNDAQECRPAKGQLVATQQRSKPQFSGDDSAAFHIADNGRYPKLRQPTAKELAAAKAARIRLGYEQADDEAGADALAAPKLPDGPEPPRPEHVDYVSLEAAKPCEDVDGCLSELKAGLQSPNWLAVCKALAVLQQLTAHHHDALSSQLTIIAPLLVKHIQSLRSQVSKVAILCYGDLVQEFEDELLPHVDGQCMPPKPSESALAQLLLKSVSKDKKFVLEASQKVLDSCAQTLDPVEMSHKFMGYLKHKNPNVRGAACGALSFTIERLQQDHRQIEQLARSGLLQAAVGLLSDRAPSARANARRIVALVKDAVAQTAGGISGDAAELASEPSSDQENIITGNVTTAPATADDATAIHSKVFENVASSAPINDTACAWASLCSDVLNPSELLNINRLIRSGGD